jgi:hypothetical protein
MSVNEKIQHFEGLQSTSDQQKQQQQERDENKRNNNNQRHKIAPTIGRNVDTNRLLKRLGSGRNQDFADALSVTPSKEDREEKSDTAEDHGSVHRTPAIANQEKESSPLGVFAVSTTKPRSSSSNNSNINNNNNISDSSAAKLRQKPTLGISVSDRNDSSPSSSSRVQLLNHRQQRTTPHAAAASTSDSTPTSKNYFFRNKSHEEQFRTLTAEASPENNQNEQKDQDGSSFSSAAIPAAGRPSTSTFSNRRAVDPESKKVLLLSPKSQQQQQQIGKSRPSISSANSIPVSPEPKRKTDQINNNNNNNNSENPITANFIPRWATPSPGSSQTRMPASMPIGGAGMPLANSVSQTPLTTKKNSNHEHPIFGSSSPFYYSPANEADAANERAKNNNKQNAVSSFPQHLFGEDPDPCPPEMLMEMMLHSTVFRENEIKMKRQIALWECYERKMVTGSFLDSPFAVEHSS